jgi:hypothetical protein
MLSVYISYRLFSCFLLAAESCMFLSLTRHIYTRHMYISSRVTPLAGPGPPKLGARRLLYKLI